MQQSQPTASPHQSMTNLDQIAQSERQKYLDSRSLLMLEAAIGCLLDTKTPEQVAKVLRDMADQLEMYL